MVESTSAFSSRDVDIVLLGNFTLFVVVPRAGTRSATPAVRKEVGCGSSFVGRCRETVGVGITPLCEALTRVGVCTFDALLNNLGVDIAVANVGTLRGAMVVWIVLAAGASESGGVFGCAVVVVGMIGAVAVVALALAMDFGRDAFPVSGFVAGKGRGEHLQ